MHRMAVATNALVCFCTMLRLATTTNLQPCRKECLSLVERIVFKCRHVELQVATGSDKYVQRKKARECVSECVRSCVSAFIHQSVYTCCY